MKADTSKIQAYFKDKQLPSQIQLSSGIKIVDVPKFISSHISVIEANNGKAFIEVYVERLRQLTKLI